MKRELLITGDEIATKGGNRRIFENFLRRNVWNALGRRAQIVPRRLFGRLSIPLPDEMTEEFVVERLKAVPGVAKFSIAWGCEATLDAMRALALEKAQAFAASSFGVRCHRGYKNFPMKSMEIEREVGGFLHQELKIPVDLGNPDLWIHLSITEQGAYVSTQFHKGMGGLPVRSSEKVIGLLSGGLDSPVACFEMFRRGCQVVLVHFLNKGMDPLGVQTKIEDLAEALNRYQQTSVLYFVPFEEIQRELIAKVPSPLRMIAYRRVMMRMANRIAIKEGAQAVVTGDSVGQVASQTIKNIQTVWQASKLPVFAPLIGRLKQEIVERSLEIGTYDISIEPYADCCQFMIPKAPATQSEAEQLLEIEATIEGLHELENRVADAIRPQIRFYPPRTGENYPQPRRKRWPSRRGARASN